MIAPNINHMNLTSFLNCGTSYIIKLPVLRSHRDMWNQSINQILIMLEKGNSIWATETGAVNESEKDVTELNEKTEPYNLIRVKNKQTNSSPLSNA